jgi:lactose/L-arabinose transport system permease protein
VSYSLVFKTIFSNDGFANDALALVGASPVNWLGEPDTARFVLILGLVWRWTGYNMIFYLSAMQNIDKSIYEAARIDGINAWGRFVYITIPLLKPVILFTSIISTIGTLQLFDEVWNITQGGPSDSTLTLSLYIYNLTFKFIPNLGYAATVSYVIVVLVALLAVIQFYAAREKAE